MALDGIFLYHLKNEIADFAVGSRVDKIYQPSCDELVIHLRRREGSKRLMLSCNADSARIHFTNHPPENPAKPPMLCLLLRKRLTGALITDVRQDNLERIVFIDFSATDELGDKTAFTLAVEIMGRYSNIIFINKNATIIDAVKRVDETKSHIRRILPGIYYCPPPNQDKLNIFTDDINTIKNKISISGKSVYKASLDTIKGISPIICRELENGLCVEDFRQMALNPVPVAIITDKPVDFTFINVRQYDALAEIREFESFSSLLDYFYYERTRLARVKARSADLFKMLSTLHERAERKAANRSAELEACSDKDLYRLYGDLINANQYRLKKGSAYYDVENYYDNNSIVRIPADSMLTPVQNAQKYYKEYRKKQSAQSKLNDFIDEANAEARYFETVIDALSRAETDIEISEIKKELYEGGYLKRSASKRKNEKPLKPIEFKTRDGFRVLVGRNNIMNDRLTLKSAKNYDTWFHVQSLAGSHVICETAGRQITDAAIHDCAVIAAYFSKARSSSNVAVDYTLVKNIKKPNGARFGYVIYDTYNTEFATPAIEEIEALKNE